MCWEQLVQQEAERTQDRGLDWSCRKVSRSRSFGNSRESVPQFPPRHLSRVLSRRLLWILTNLR